MDPTANLDTQLALAEALVNDPNADEDAKELAEHVLALDAWINGGGFLPSRWTKN